MHIRMKEKHRVALEKARAEYGAEYVSWDPSTGTVNVHKFRMTARYKKLRALLPNYEQSFVDNLYLHDQRDIDLSDGFYDTIAAKDSPQLASRAFSIINSGE